MVSINATPKIFISYSRKDIGFANLLEVSLRKQGFEVLIDRENIYAFEDWWLRIQTLIGSADTVVFVLSPDAVTSNVALKEIEFAASLNKRFAPIVCRRVDAELVPASLRRLNFIVFDDPSQYETSTDQLAQALRTDIVWIRKHTEFGEASRRWSVLRHPHGLLLRSPALEEAELWIASRPHNAPLPTNETQAFITESRRWTSRRRNILSSSLAIGLILALALAGIAYRERSLAVTQRDIAETRRVATLAALTTSELLRGNVDTALRLGIHATQLSANSVGDNYGDSVARTALVNAIVKAGWQLTLRHLHAPTFSPDGLRILAVSYNDMKKNWETQIRNAATGDKVAEWSGGLSQRFSANGTRIVELVERKFARVLDAETGVGIASLHGHAGDLNSASFSPDGQLVVTSSQDKAAIVWDSTSGNQIVSLKGHDEPVNSAMFNHDGSRIVTASNDGTARVWDAKTGTLIRVLRGHEDKVVSASFSSDGSRIVTASYDQTARLWDSESGVQLTVLSGHSFVLNSAEFNADASRVLTTSWDHTARLWNAESGAQITSVYSSGSSDFGFASASFSPDGSQIAVGSGAVLRIVDAASGKELLAYNGHEGPIGYAAFSPDGSQVISEAFGSELRVWAVAKVPEIATLHASDSRLNSIEISPHGTAVIATSEDGTLRIWIAKTRKELLKWNAYLTQSAHYSPDGFRFVLVYSGVAEVFDALTLKSIAKLSRRDVNVWIDDAQFSPDGQRIVTTSSKLANFNSSDYSATIWNINSGRELVTLEGHSNHILSASFSPDGSQVVTSSEDKTARVWNAETGASIASLIGHTDWVTNAFFSPDAAHVITQSHDHTVIRLAILTP